MLDPKARRVLLPQDREIIAITGMTEDEYIQFWIIAQKEQV